MRNEYLPMQTHKRNASAWDVGLFILLSHESNNAIDEHSSSGSKWFPRHRGDALGGFCTVVPVASYLPCILSKSPDASASGLERRACPQKCKYRLANQSDWSHSLECPSFTDAIYRCRKARRRSWIEALFVQFAQLYMRSYVHPRMYRHTCMRDALKNVSQAFRVLRAVQLWK